MKSTTGKSRNGTLRMLFKGIPIMIGVAGVAYGWASNRIDDRCETIDAQIQAVRSDVLRDAARLDRQDAVTILVEGRLARIEAKVGRLEVIDAKLDRLIEERR